MRIVRRSSELEAARDVPIRSISRGIAVLTALNRNGAMPMMEIAKSTALPYPTVNRIVQTLLHEGLVEREPARKYYRVTPLVRALSSGYQADDELVGIARSHIERLCLETAWPVSLLTRVGTQMVIRDSTHTMTSQTFTNYFPGYAMPIAGSASGKVYLAFCCDTERRTIIDAWKKGDEANALQGLELISDDGLINKIRDQGYAFNIGMFDSFEPGKTSAISVPILGEDGYILSSLTLIYFSSTMAPEAAVERYLETLLGVAENISNEFSADGRADRHSGDHRLN